MNIKPYQIKAEQQVIDDLQKRLKRTRWPDTEENSGWSHGTSLNYMKELTKYWLSEYDWRKEEAGLNEFSWFSAEIDGKTVPFIYEKGKGPDSTPLILFHGWPDSILRYTKLIPMLTDPEAHGGSADGSFDVVIPAHIGGFSNGEPPVPSPHEIKDVAELGWRLMTEGLGYKKFAAGGGDGGSPMAQILAINHTDSVIGLHLTDAGWHMNQAQYPDLLEAEQEYLQKTQMTAYREGAYAMLQGTKPQTLAFGLNDSPVGMATWIIEKFQSWGDCDGDIEKIFTKDELLTNIMLYWLRNSARAFSYREEFVSPSIQPDQEVEVPVGIAHPPNDLMGTVPPREFEERNLKNIRHWSILDCGGHFAAMEYPELVAKDIRIFFSELATETAAK